MGRTFVLFLALPLLSLASPRYLQDPRVCTFGESWFTSFCTLTCPGGFAKDENGCDLCRCADQPAALPTLTSRPALPTPTSPAAIPTPVRVYSSNWITVFSLTPQPSPPVLPTPVSYQPACPPHTCDLVPDTPYGQAPCSFGVAADGNGCVGDPCNCYQQPEGCSTMPCYYWTTCAVYRTDDSGCAICYPPCADGSMPGIIIG
ncbi:hypothetical protein Bbelb_077240 [Branchiostoma belcheri]|nr:hypothetical protein Bbelb_077240 [Branchiostoma belcheri]